MNIIVRRTLEPSNQNQVVNVPQFCTTLSLSVVDNYITVLFLADSSETEQCTRTFYTTQYDDDLPQEPFKYVGSVVQNCNLTHIFEL